MKNESVTLSYWNASIKLRCCSVAEDIDCGIRKDRQTHKCKQSKR